MEKKKTLLLLGILIVLLLAMGIAFLRTNSSPQRLAPAEVSQPRDYRNNWVRKGAVPSQKMEDLKEEEILGIPASRADAERRVAPTPDLPSPTNADGQKFQNNRPYVPERISGRPGNVYHSTDQAFQEGNNSRPYRDFNRYSGGGNSGLSGQGPALAESGLSSQERIKEMVSPFLGGLSKKQASDLNRSLNEMPARIERAILRAMLPKSKKDANIEKYLQRNRADGTTTTQESGPFAEVLNQVASQKANIVKSMGNAYGAAAAKDAGKVMDAYQKELSNTLNNSAGKTPEQVAQQARQLSQKYNEKLEKVSQQRGLEKYKNELIEKDNAFLADIERSYGSEVASKMGQTFEQARQRELELAQAGLSPEEYYQQLVEEQDRRRKEAQNVVTSSGQSLKGYFDAEDKKVQKLLSDLQEDEAQGKTVPVVYRASQPEVDSRVADVLKQKESILPKVQPMYGQEGAQRVEKIYQSYEQEVRDLWEDAQTTYEEKIRRQEEARQKANRQLEELQRSPEMRQALENNQVETALTQIMQDPSLANASAEERAALENAARPILRDMYAEINALPENLSPQERDRKIKEIQQQAQQRLSGGGQQNPNGQQ